MTSLADNDQTTWYKHIKFFFFVTGPYKYWGGLSRFVSLFPQFRLDFIQSAQFPE